MLAGLPLTGERTVPGLAIENYWFRRHEAAYLHLGHSIQGGLLVEVGAGEGYGAALLAERADLVIAIDYDELSVVHLARSYRALHAVRGNLACLPVASGTVDVVASLQVIEHVWNHPQFIAECARVLRPGGLLLITTPNRLTFSPNAATGAKPINPFHTHEFTAAELSRLVGHSGLAVTSLHGLSNGKRLAALDTKYAGLGVGTFIDAQLASIPGQWSHELTEEVASVSADDFAVTSAADDCLDLILQARRL
jgi:SAM-dependent methyltransferase